MDATKSLPGRALRLADDPGDDDDLRLRKRIGVAAGYLTVVAPLSVPFLALGHPLAVLIGVSLAAFSIANLVVLARSRRFERYVVALVTAGTIFVPIATWFSGGPTMAHAGLVWGFLIPAYALLALGPRRVPAGTRRSWPSSLPRSRSSWSCRSRWARPRTWCSSAARSSTPWSRSPSCS